MQGIQVFRDENIHLDAMLPLDGRMAAASKRTRQDLQIGMRMRLSCVKTRTRNGIWHCAGVNNG